jgi:transposase-like protein/IS1 family transposase
VTCHYCRANCKKSGFYGRTKIQRYRCLQCRKSFSDAQTHILGSMRIPVERAEQVLHCLLEGCSIRSTERLTGINRNTIMSLLLEVGQRCDSLLRRKLQSLAVQRIQCDELHCFVGKREKHTSIEESDEVGEQYTFIGMCADTKLVFSWLTGKRSQVNTYTFMRDLYSRTAWGSCPQITTDGWRPYVGAVNATFRDSVDFAQLVKIYGHLPEPRGGYAPSRFVEAVSKVITGNPDRRFVSTSYIERQNLTLTMMSRRFTRLTNAFSKKLTHLKAAISLHFAYYNLCRVHASLRVTPCMS